MSPHQESNSFFGNVSTENMPAADTKAQPWKKFHELQKELTNTGTIEVDIPGGDATGLYQLSFDRI